MDRVIALSDALARRKRTLLRGGRLFSMKFLCKCEALTEARARVKRVTW